MHKSIFIIFLAEIIGTFGLVVAATGSIVFDGRLGGILGIGFISAIHFIGLGLLIFLFGRYSMAHFNPAVTIGFFISGYVNSKQIPIYFAAQAIGAILGSLFVKFVIGDYSNLGLNYPNYEFPLTLIFTIEVIASIFLMGSILVSINVKKLSVVFVSMIIAATVALDVFFFGSISGASMNPIRSSAPAVFTGIYGDLWLYWSAPFVGTIIVGFIYKFVFRSIKNHN